MHEGKVEQVGSPREVYDSPANEFVMGFLGPAVRMEGELVRPHDLKLSLVPQEGTTEAVVTRVVHLGFEVRAEVELPDRTQARVQLTREQAAELELSDGDLVYVRAPQKAREAAVA
jgi:sulfate transport system ATP-binding protein